MLRSVLAWIGARLGRGGAREDAADPADADETSAESDDGPIRSRLDASVLFAHGLGGSSDPELNDVQTRATELEETKREARRRNR